MTSSNFFSQFTRTQKYEVEIPNATRGLVFGSIISFIASCFLLFSFSSPYWLVSWQHAFSTFQGMGLWEFCFKDYRHPNYQFDKLFNGCFYIFSEEYRIIREWLLPGWLQAVQAFVTLALITSLISQILSIPLLIKWPLKLMLKSAWLLTVVTSGTNLLAGGFLLLGVSIFGGCAFRRDWMPYPNFSYLSWSYSFAVVSMIFHLLSFSILFNEFKSELAKYREGTDQPMLPIPLEPVNVAPSIPSTSTVHSPSLISDI